LLGEWGVPADSSAGRQQFAGQMQARPRGEGSGDDEPQGWCLGSEEFRGEPLAAVTQAASHRGEKIRLSAEAKAQRIIQDELHASG
jgi:hypothetical protein